MARPLRVLHITKRFAPLQGGVERYVRDLATAQLALGHDCRVLTIDHDILEPGSALLPRRERIDGIDVARVRAVGSQRKQFVAESALPFLRHLRWADVIHHHDPRFAFETTLAFRLASGTPIIFHSHGLILHTPAFRLVKELMLRGYYGPVLRHLVDAVIAISQSDADLLREMAGVEGKRVRLVPGGSDLAPFVHLPRTPERGRIFAFGRIDVHKGHARLFEALAGLEGDWQLDVAGGGPAELVDALKARAAELGLTGRIRWLGHIDRPELQEALSSADLVVFPSEAEGFGLALVEALAAGSRVVASEIPTHREIIGDELPGWLSTFEPADGREAIHGALAEPLAMRTEQAVMARSRAALFSVGRLASEVEEIYRELHVGARRE